MSYEHFLTVGQLKQALAALNLPDDAPVYYQRIEDSYFNDKTSGWVTEKRPSFDVLGQETEYIRAWGVCRRFENALFLDGHY